MVNRSQTRVPLFRCALAAVGVGMALLLGSGPLRAEDTANSALFWIEEQLRGPRPRPPVVQRIRRLMPHRQFARPTYWHERPSAPIYRTRPAIRAPEPTVAALPRAEPGPRPDAKAATPQASVATVGSPTTPPTAPFVVAVIGDSLAQWLTTGLTEAYPAGQGVTVVGKARESTGLVRDDFYDWPKALRELVNGTHLDALVVMIGSNDRQPLRGAAGPEEPLSAGWETLYGKRIDALIEIAREKKISVLWVGMPIMKSERYSQDIGAINALDRTRAEASGAKFIDVFDAFADEKGQYSAFGPDVDGQIVKLRTGDGIHFTTFGARKLAHFVEAEIRHLRDIRDPPQPVVATLPLDIATTPLAPDAALPETSATRGLALPVAAPEKPAVGPIVSLTAAPISPGGKLLGPPNSADASRPPGPGTLGSRQ